MKSDFYLRIQICFSQNSEILFRILTLFSEFRFFYQNTYLFFLSEFLLYSKICFIFIYILTDFFRIRHLLNLPFWGDK